MITNEFKEQLRQFIMAIFDVSESFLYSPWSLSDDMSFDDSLFIMRSPILTGKEILNFFKEEGLKVDDIGMGLFRVSLAL